MIKPRNQVVLSEELLEEGRQLVKLLKFDGVTDIALNYKINDYNLRILKAGASTGQQIILSGQAKKFC